MSFTVLLTNVASLAAGLGWLWVLAGLGAALLDKIGYRPAGPALRVAHAAALGAAAAGTLFLGLLWAGLYRPWVVLASTAALALALRHRLADVAGSLRAGALAAFRRARADRSDDAALVAIAVLGGAAAILAVAPVADWDSLMYHLDVPAEFLASGGLHLPVDNLHVSRVGLVQLLHGVPLALGLPAAAAVLIVGFAGALALAVWGLAERWAPGAGPFATACASGTAMLLLVSATPRVDTPLTLFLLLAAGVLASDETDRAALVTVGILLGAAFATKFVAGPYLVILGIVVLWTAGPGPTDRVRAGAIVGGIATLVALPWLARNALLLGAPFYPFLADPVPPPWITAAVASGAGAAGTGPDPTLMAGQGQWIWSLRPPFRLTDFVLAPGRMTVETEGRFYFAHPILVFLPLLALRPRRPLLLLAVPALAFVAGLALLLPGLSLRYLMPGLVALTLVAAVLAYRTLGRSWLRIAVLGLALAPGFAALGLQLERTGAAAHAAGLTTPTRYLRNHPETAGLTRAAAMVDRHVPADGRVLMLFEARGFGFPRPVLQDNKGTNWPYLAGTAALERCLPGTGIGHLLVADRILEYYVRVGLDPALLEWDAFDRFRQRCLTRVADVSGYTLYRVVDAGAGAVSVPPAR